MTLSATEQYLLELINRARLDPAGEAARYGINLNEGLAPGTLGTEARQVLASNALLETAAISHSKWMIASDVFDHVENNGSRPADRATASGYSWSNVGENIAWRGTTGQINFSSAIAEQHQDLFLSHGHRENMLSNSFREIGISQEGGSFALGGRNYDSSMVTELFGKSGSKVFVTGVTYSDANGDDFYTIGEARGGVHFAAPGAGATSASSGGYAMAVAQSAALAVNGYVGALHFSAVLDTSKGNVKLDVVDGNTFFTSGNITLGSGIQRVQLLGTAALHATGNAATNLIYGNAAGNTLSGAGGNDYLNGGRGSDLLNGGDGNDKLLGAVGNDRLLGGAGMDSLLGGDGLDRLAGQTGNDQLTGGANSDTFIFTNGFGYDRVTDFSVAGHDRIEIDNAVWGGAAMTSAQVVSRFAHMVSGHVEFHFSSNENIILTGVTSTAGLAGLLHIF